MNIRIETYSDIKYESIEKEYGSVLNKFGLAKADDESAYITVNALEDLFELDKELSRLDDEKYDWGVYFGIVVTHEREVPLLVIKDNYD
jgi:hypothetical protein